MSQLDFAAVEQFIKETIGPEFHKRRFDSLEKLTLAKILTSKNPYLFRAKGINTAREYLSAGFEAIASSGEEAILGDCLELIAIFICKQVHGGQKISTPGLDLDFTSQGKRYLISIKSGPKWSNSRQKKSYWRTLLARSGLCGLLVVSRY